MPAYCNETCWELKRQTVTDNIKHNSIGKPSSILFADIRFPSTVSNIYFQPCLWPHPKHKTSSFKLWVVRTKKIHEIHRNVWNPAGCQRYRVLRIGFIPIYRFSAWNWTKMIQIRSPKVVSSCHPCVFLHGRKWLQVSVGWMDSHSTEARRNRDAKIGSWEIRNKHERKQLRKAKHLLHLDILWVYIYIIQIYIYIYRT